MIVLLLLNKGTGSGFLLVSGINSLSSWKVLLEVRWIRSCKLYSVSRDGWLTTGQSDHSWTWSLSPVLTIYFCSTGIDVFIHHHQADPNILKILIHTKYKYILKTNICVCKFTLSTLKHTKYWNCIVLLVSPCFLYDIYVLRADHPTPKASSPLFCPTHRWQIDHSWLRKQPTCVVVFLSTGHTGTVVLSRLITRTSHNQVSSKLICNCFFSFKCVSLNLCVVKCALVTHGIDNNTVLIIIIVEGLYLKQNK